MLRQWQTCNLIDPLIAVIAYDIVLEIVSSLHFTQNFEHETFLPNGIAEILIELLTHSFF